ncbi:MAG: type IV pilus twitching motility protein PilT [Thermoanaerobaculia bacterium]
MNDTPKPKVVNDENLARLVRELNADRGAAVRPVEEAALEGSAGTALRRLLFEADRRGATDVLLVPGAPPVVRVAGRLERLGEDMLADGDVDAMFRPLLTPDTRRTFEAGAPVDLALRIAGEGEPLRYRLNLHRQRGVVAASLRRIHARIPTLAELNLPRELADVIEPVRGLVLVCGPTGSGKSTTLAAMIGEINAKRSCHIVTIEDPIEYEHRHGRSIVEQVEVGRDVPDFATALRAALRQDPDVILVGEIRDADTAATALAAAETGHLILATLHTNDVVQSIHRLVDIFPPERHAQVRQQLSFCLNAIVCQQLVAATDGKLVPVVELLLPNDAVRTHIRTGHLQNLYNELTLGQRSGMVTFEKSLARLVESGRLPLAEARRRASRPEELDSILRRPAQG